MEELYLINGLLSRNRIIFDFIFHYYYSGLCAYSERLTRDEQAAEDIVQELFIYLWIRHKQLQINSSLKNYLFTSVKNRSIDFIKREKRKAKTLTNLSNNKECIENLSSFWFAESELEAEITKSLEKLPPRCRQIFELSRFRGLKNQEIADKLDVSKRTVELQITNALKQLRTDLEPYLPISLLMVLFQ